MENDASHFEKEIFQLSKDLWLKSVCRVSVISQVTNFLQTFSEISIFTVKTIQRKQILYFQYKPCLNNFTISKYLTLDFLIVSIKCLISKRNKATTCKIYDVIVCNFPLYKKGVCDFFHKNIRVKLYAFKVVYHMCWAFMEYHVI